MDELAGRSRGSDPRSSRARPPTTRQRPDAGLQGQALDPDPGRHGRRPGPGRWRTWPRCTRGGRGGGDGLHPRPDRRRQPATRWPTSWPNRTSSAPRSSACPSRSSCCCSSSARVLAAFMPLVLSIISILLAVALTAPHRPDLPDEHLRPQHPHDDGPRGGHRLHALHHLPLPRGARPRPGEDRRDRRDRAPPPTAPSSSAA